jgi:hypothetical protein
MNPKGLSNYRAGRVSFVAVDPKPVLLTSTISLKACLFVGD